MEQFLKILSDVRVLIGIAVLIVLIVIWFISQKIKASGLRKRLEELETRYNAIKSEPLTFKLNKADAISRIDPETREQILTRRDEFEKAQANIKQIGQTLADTEDEILVGKLKDAKEDIANLEASIDLGEQQVKSLSTFLNGILEKETEQRERVTDQKARFRQLRETAQNNSNQLSYVWDSIEQTVDQVEKSFSSYEEWAYANDFEKASNELEEIDSRLNYLESLITILPTVLSDARGVIPGMIESLRNEYNISTSRGVFLDHLHVDNNLTLITSSLKEDLSNLKETGSNEIVANIADYKTRLAQLAEEIKKENDSFDELNTLRDDTANLIKANSDLIDVVKDKYNKIESRFDISDMNEQIVARAEDLNSVIKQVPEVEAQAKAGGLPASQLVLNYKELNQKLDQTSKAIKELRDTLDTYSGDEDRAKKQLLKLQVIMNQMQLKINKHKLPAISDQYEADMVKADEYIKSIERLIGENPLNVQMLNNTLKEAIDFIYKLYNNVNNMIATVVMLENTIVFGNRYRSTYADIDSELTRSELCFRNGDYTKALSIAISTIEKIYPGNYENMIRENAKSAE